jgi:hypothetical protein
MPFEALLPGPIHANDLANQIPAFARGLAFPEKEVGIAYTIEPVIAMLCILS